jgi:hypothetical protein
VLTSCEHGEIVLENMALPNTTLFILSQIYDMLDGPSGHLPAETVVSNSAGGMDVCLW